jgi:fibronectin-binding autotransporter adhesin
VEVNDAAATVAISDSYFIDNSADAAGGGVDVFSGVTATITGSTFLGNYTRANFGGGVNLVTTGTNAAGTASSLIDDTVVGNSSILTGGGVEVFGGDFNLISDTITGNFATGVHVNSGTAFFLDTIDAGNFLQGFGGDGVDVTVSLFGQATSRGGNFIGVGSNLNRDVLFPSGGPNANGDFAGTRANPLVPMLGPLQANGGRLAGAPGDQVVVPTEALLAGSPAIGKGIAGAPTSDQRGFPRVPNNTDIGAFTLQALSSAMRLTSSANPATFQQTVTFTASVSGLLPAANIAPTGTMTFTLDGTPQAPVPLVKGAASFTPASTLTVGLHTITAAYRGDSTFAGSLRTLTETVSPVATNTMGGPVLGPGLAFGGGIFNGGVLTLDASTVGGNTTTLRGGGIQNAQTFFSSINGVPQPPATTLTVTNSTISGNGVTNVGAGVGGGLDNAFANANLTNCTIANKVGGAFAGGITNDVLLSQVRHRHLLTRHAHADPGDGESEPDADHADPDTRGDGPWPNDHTDGDRWGARARRRHADRLGHVHVRRLHVGQRSAGRFGPRGAPDDGSGPGQSNDHRRLQRRHQFHEQHIHARHGNSPRHSGRLGHGARDASSPPPRQPAAADAPGAERERSAC